ncbi:MAG: hypothetical protein K5867_05545 [Bacteroidales bacterium]|nr:hypothetical protein [Bacteroidales bacterium]
MKSTLKIASILLTIGILMVSCGGGNGEKKMLKAAENFKRELPESYVILGECMDSLVQKIYYTNRVSPTDDANMCWQDNLDDITDTKYPKSLLELIAKDTAETFIKVYDLQTKETKDIDLSKFTKKDGDGFVVDAFDMYGYGVRFSHYANGKLYLSVPASRLGSNIYCINVYSDEISCVDRDASSQNVRIEGGKLVYSKYVCTNDDEIDYVNKFECDRIWATKDFTIDL